MVKTNHKARWRRCPLLALCLFFLTVGSCTQKKEDPELNRLKARLTEMESQYKGFEGKIRSAADDVGLRSQLEEDRALLKSRMERVKLLIKKGDPLAFKEADAAEGAKGEGAAHH